MPSPNILTWEQKVQFTQQVAAARECFAALCRAFRISRKTGYKWWQRYQRGGEEALRDGSRAPRRRPHQLRALWIERIVRARRALPRFGPKKLRVWLQRMHPRATLPAASTIGGLLQQLGLTRPRPRRPKGPRRSWPARRRACGPNDLWTVDFKGFFHTANGERCDVLTVRDLHSRYGLCARIFPDQRLAPVRAEFLRLFARYGLPKAIHMDQGTPFGSAGPAHLSALSAWWIRLGIAVQFSRRGHPEDNAGHEQWHRELKAATARPPAATRRAQQWRTTRWLRFYNEQRPHEALGQRAPAEFYRRSRRRYRGEQPPPYRRGEIVRRVRRNGEMHWRGRSRFVGEAFADGQLALRRHRRGIWRVYYYHLLIGELHEQDRGGMRPAHYHRRRQTGRNV